MGCNIRHFSPKLECLIVIFVNGCPEPVLIQSPNMGEKFPGPLNGFFLVIIPKGPIPQHFKKCMVEGVHTHFFQIIMFPRNTNAFLTIHSSQIIRCDLIQKDGFKLVHPRIGKQ